MAKLCLSNVRNVEIDPHSTENAILLRYDIEDGKDSVIRKSKIIQLKNFSDKLNPSGLAKSITEQCAMIGPERQQDVEQVIFYLQRRVATKHDLFKANGSTEPANNNHVAQVVQLEEYIEMLYEDADKLKASSLILSLCIKPSNLKIISQNDVLLGALTRVFREDSRKNFELGTNLASIFFQLSLFTKFHSLLSHYKIGAFSLQFVENELKRFDLWQEQQAQSNSVEQRRKWDLAIKKQEIFVVECLKILTNLAYEICTEIKMIKRGLLSCLAKCLDHVKSPFLLKTSIRFLWKLSVYTENKQAMESLRITNKVIELLPSADAELLQISFALFFNLSFDPALRTLMVNAGLINHVAPYISNNEFALGLLYQLSIVDDAKAIITFTDSISTLMQLLCSKHESLLVKGTLINVAVEKRNAQLICGADGHGLDFIITEALQEKDPLLMKLARQVATHEGAIQQHFVKHLSTLVQAVQLSLKQISMPTYAVEALAILASVSSLQWDQHAETTNTLLSVLSRILHDQNQKALVSFADEVLIQVVACYGMLAAQATWIGERVLATSDQLIMLLNHKQEDDEFVLQIAFCFARLIANPELISKVCTQQEQILEYLINMTHDKNQQLCMICDQALQLVSEINAHWFKRIAEERFCWHNAQWLDIVEGRGAQGEERVLSDDEALLGTDDDESFLSEQFRRAVFGVDEILGSTELVE